MKHYVGLDVSLKEVSICVVDADGIVAAEGKVSTEPALILSCPTSTVPFKRSFQHNSLCGLRRLLALHFGGFEDQASRSRMLGGRATPADWKTRPT